MEQSRSMIDETCMGILAKSQTRTFVDLNGVWEYKDSDEVMQQFLPKKKKEPL